MSELILGGLLVAVGSVLGGALGWLMRGSQGAGSRFSTQQRLAAVAPLQTPAAPRPTQPVVTRPVVAQPVVAQRVVAQPVAAQEPPKFEAFEEMMARLHQLTETVAADVGEHNSHIQEISEELAEAGGTEAGVMSVVEKLVKANEAMQAQLQSAEERLQDQAREMESHVLEARTDALTKLFNRRAFDDEMKRAEDEANKNGRATCVLMMDVDHFKKFNDTYGHQAGDEVLRGVARVLKKNLAGKEIVCRYGGEEFVVIFPGADIEAARTGAERARAAIAEEIFEFEGMDLRVTASAGLAQLQPAETGDALVKRADDALYVCKEAGRNNGHWHDGENSHPMSVSPAAPKSPAAEPALEEPSPIEGVSDRETFCKDIDRRISEYKRGGASMAVVVVEIDRYPELITKFGGKAGEVVLRATAQFLKATMREMDHVARLEQSEFGLLLPGAQLDDAGDVAERLRNAVQRCVLPVDGNSVQFSISVGATEIAMNDDVPDLLGRAKASVKVAKDAGGNRTVSADEHGEFESMTLSS